MQGVKQFYFTPILFWWNMQKDLMLTELFDLYGGLLTERQRELFTSYYVYDLSLSEISEPEGKTRQSVYEQVKKVKQKLIEYEEVLKLKEKNDQLKKLAQTEECKKNGVADKIISIIGV